MTDALMFTKEVSLFDALEALLNTENGQTKQESCYQLLQLGLIAKSEYSRVSGVTEATDSALLPKQSEYHPKVAEIAKLLQQGLAAKTFGEQALEPLLTLVKNLNAKEGSE